METVEGVFGQIWHLSEILYNKMTNFNSWCFPHKLIKSLNMQTSDICIIDIKNKKFLTCRRSYSCI